MNMKLIILLSTLFSLNANAEIPNKNNSNFSYIGEKYTVYILSHCENPIDCRLLTARFINNDTKKTFDIKKGETINIGYGRNLRGFLFYGKNNDYMFNQPVKGDDLDKWDFRIVKKGHTDNMNNLDANTIYKEKGDYFYIK
ncbi:hypothetical protein [Rouxiella sp. Mn2063]|uniref:hypothetical protein n=1 Tax=Rouxiella sp. Mn2063 TaxID=3395262 RepID=UPI003BBC1960